MKGGVGVENRGYGNEGESSISNNRPDTWRGQNFWGKTHKLNIALRKLEKRDVGIPTLNEQRTSLLPSSISSQSVKDFPLFKTWGMSIYEGL